MTESMMYVVQRGDTLSKIADTYYGVMRLFEAIAEHNGIDDPDYIEEGQEIELPAMDDPIHVVSSGETLGSIAKYWFGNASRYMEIAERNSLDDPDYIEEGQELAIPIAVSAGC